MSATTRAGEDQALEVCAICPVVTPCRFWGDRSEASACISGVVGGERPQLDAGHAAGAIPGPLTATQAGRSRRSGRFRF